jgi:hypothetical protein
MFCLTLIVSAAVQNSQVKKRIIYRSWQRMGRWGERIKNKKYEVRSKK